MVADGGIYTKQLRITPAVHEALETLRQESGISQAMMADRILMPVLALVDRHGWYRVIEELKRSSGKKPAHRIRKPRRVGGPRKKDTPEPILGELTG